MPSALPGGPDGAQTDTQVRHNPLMRGGYNFWEGRLAGNLLFEIGVGPVPSCGLGDIIIQPLPNVGTWLVPLLSGGVCLDVNAQQVAHQHPLSYSMPHLPLTQIPSPLPR